MDYSILARDWRTAKYAEGVFIHLTGYQVHEFDPWPKVDGFLDAMTMTADEAAAWLAYCVNVLGYAYNGQGVCNA